MPQQTIRQYFKALTILHFALVTGVILFSIMAYTVYTSGSFITDDDVMTKVCLYMVPLLAIMCIVGGRMVYKKQVNEIKNMRSLAAKLNAYRRTFILRDALLEGPALFGVMAYLLTGEIVLLGIAALLLIVFMLLRPTKDMLAKDLELSADETTIIEDDDAEIN